MKKALLYLVFAISASAQTSPPSFVKGDFDGDGVADQVGRKNFFDHMIAVRHFSEELGRVVESNIGPTGDGSWMLEADGDFDGDGRADIFFRNASTGENAIWFMDGIRYARGAAVMAVTDQNWQVGASADFDHDGKADLLWRNRVTGENAIWFMNAENYAAGTRILSVDDANWAISGAADFNGDTQQDLVWRNAITGANVIWLMNGTQYAGGVELNSVTAAGDWQIVGTGDANGDHQPDIYWRQMNPPDSSWRVNVWYMSATSYSSGEFLFESSGNYDEVLFGK